MDGLLSFSTWPIRDAVIVLLIVFNAGGLVFTMTNHMSSLKKGLAVLKEAHEKDCEELKAWCVKLTGEVHDLAERVSRLEGRVNTTERR